MDTTMNIKFFLDTIYLFIYYMYRQAKYPQLAGKVTGMLLEMDKEDLISLINDRESLESKADEAVNVLEQHRASQTTEE